GAVTAGLEGLPVRPVPGVEDVHRAEEGSARTWRALWIAGAKRIQAPVPRVAGRQGAVEEGVSERKGAHEVIRTADPQSMLGGRFRQSRDDPAQRIGQKQPIRTQWPSTEAVAVEANACELARARAPQ